MLQFIFKRIKKKKIVFVRQRHLEKDKCLIHSENHTKKCTKIAKQQVVNFCQ